MSDLSSFASSPCSPSACAYWPDMNATSMPESALAVSFATMSSLVVWLTIVVFTPVACSNCSARSSG